MRRRPRLTYILDESLKKQAEILKTINDAVGESLARPAAGDDVDVE